MKWITNLDEKWFNLIKSGDKSVELRVFDGERADYKLGDTLVFKCKNKEIQSIISGLIYYQSFEEALSEENYLRAIPDAASLEDALSVYHSYPNFKERAAKYGVVAIRLV
jgi:ASC-1-like (ASCH) protein